MKVGTYTGATAYVVNDNVFPQMLIIKKTAGNFPSRLIVKLAGRGTVKDLTLAAMIRETELVNKFQSPYALGFLAIPLADGYLGNQRLTVEITCGAAADAFELFYWNQNHGTMIYLTEQMKAFAKQPLRMENFGYLVIEGATDNDTFNLVFQNGVSHPATTTELMIELTEQTASNTAATDLAIDNLAMEYKSVEIIADADRQVFRSYWVEA
jgi:hypothetical protein